MQKHIIKTSKLCYFYILSYLKLYKTYLKYLKYQNVKRYIRRSIEGPRTLHFATKTLYECPSLQALRVLAFARTVH